jgi:hypothetical protein
MLAVAFWATSPFGKPPCARPVGEGINPLLMKVKLNTSDKKSILSKGDGK